MAARPRRGIVVLAISLATRRTYGGIEWAFTLINYRDAFDPLYLRIYLRSFILAAATTAATAASSARLSHLRRQDCARTSK